MNGEFKGEIKENNIEQEWEKLILSCKDCSECKLREGRTNLVFGRGSRNASILFIGEGPGEMEDRQGLPFVGKAGQLLDQVLLALEIPEDDYYIANIVKCRPPRNRAPEPEEVRACIPFLREQTRLIKPKIIVCLGGVAAKCIYEKDAQISKIRGTVKKGKGYLIIPTYHPAYILRKESAKHPFWEDMLKVRKYLLETRDKDDE